MHSLLVVALQCRLDSVTQDIFLAAPLHTLPPPPTPALQSLVTDLVTGVGTLLSAGVTGKILVSNLPAPENVPVRVKWWQLLLLVVVVTVLFSLIS